MEITAPPRVFTQLPGNDTAGTWVRVATPLAGTNWGTNFLPRVGQEVSVTFIEGDIDRPMVTGTLYNGQGATDAQHNQINTRTGQATANAPAWFAGDTGAHAHPAVLSGIKTQVLATSPLGTGGYNQLVFDATPNQLRAELATTQYHSRLSLGHLKQQADNARQADRGHGAELATEATGAVRAGQGLLITTEAGDQQLTADGALAGLQAAHSLAQALSQAADQQQAIVDGDDETQDRAAIQALADTHDGLKQTTAGSSPASPASDRAIKATAGGAGDAFAWRRPDLILSATAGIAALTPQDHIAVAGHSHSVTATDINQTTQNSYAVAAGEGIRLLTQGENSNPHKPNTETGIHLHAASGPVTAQAQSGAITLAAEQAVTLASTQASVRLNAPDHLLLTAGGAGLTLDGPNITLTAPGAVTFHAGSHNVAGPKAAVAENASFSNAGLKSCELQAEQAEKRGSGTIELA